MAVLPPASESARGARERGDTEALVRRILHAISESLGAELGALVANAARVEALVSHLERLSRASWILARRGRSIYMDQCERCHGAYGHPAPVAEHSGALVPRDLTGLMRTRPSDRELALLVRHGRRGMPALGGDVSDDDTRALVAFVRLLSPGYETYEVSCVRCHGDEGVPPAGGRGARPGIVFDRAYFAAHDPRYLRTKVWHMVSERGTDAMPHFRGLLDENQARAIIQYLRAMPAR